MRKKILVIVCLVVSVLIKAQSPNMNLIGNNVSCFGGCNATVSVSIVGGTPPYTTSLNTTTYANSGSVVFTGLCSGNYSITTVDANSFSVTAFYNINQPPLLFSYVSTPSYSICKGSCVNLFGAGSGGTLPYSYNWSPGFATGYSYLVCPLNSTNYAFTVIDANSCVSTYTLWTIVDSTCADVWPGDANSDGIADNLDVLELGLHYTQTGASRATTNNNWQSYFANNWVGTIANGKNLNHSDCNGDGTINNDDTLAIYNNYSLTHAFKTAQTTTVNPQLSIVPDQVSVVKGNWGTASVYLGDATTNINNINGVAFTVDFDKSLIEPNSIYVEYQNSFIDASQNLHFRKLDFANNKLFTATTHTINNNVSGFGKIATLHYQILSSLATDQTLTIGLSQANQSDASGNIVPLTSGSGTLLAVGSSVGIKEVLNSNNVSFSPNPTNGVLNIVFGTIPQNAKIELYNSFGALVLTEALSNKNNTINTSLLSDGMFVIKVLENNKVITVQKIVKQ